MRMRSAFVSCITAFCKILSFQLVFIKKKQKQIE